MLLPPHPRLLALSRHSLPRGRAILGARTGPRSTRCPVLSPCIDVCVHAHARTHGYKDKYNQ